MGGQILLGEVRFENLELPRPVKREQYGGDQGDCEPEGACLHEAESGWGAQHKEHEQQGGHKQGAPQAGLSIVKLPHAGQSGHFVSHLYHEGQFYKKDTDKPLMKSTAEEIQKSTHFLYMQM